MAEVRYIYLCSANADHEVAAPFPVTKCYAMKDGKPCPGKLKQVAGPRPKKPVVA